MSQDMERAPLSELIAFEGKKLAEVMARAYSSKLYRKRWKRAGVRLEVIQGVGDLRKPPFTTGHDVERAYRDEGMDGVICSEVATWFYTMGSDGTLTWVPYSKQDILLALEHLARLSRVVGIADDDIILMMTYPAPAPSDAIPYFAAYAHRLKMGLSGEIIPLSLEILELRTDWIDFCQQREPTVLCAPPSGALKLAEVISKPLLERLRVGLFYGEPLGPYRESLRNTYGLEPYEIYGFTGFLLFNVECQAHDGIHIWLDGCIPEIIPQAELDRERAAISYKPEAVLLTKAKPELLGEYVVTTFGEALPLIRYRTGDIVQVVSTEQCQCGRAHPKIRRSLQAIPKSC